MNQSNVDRVARAVQARVHDHYWRLQADLGDEVAMRHTRQRFGLTEDQVSAIALDAYRDAV